MSKKWKSSEISYLKRFAASKLLDELAQRFDTDVPAVQAKLAELKLESKEGPVEASGDPLLATFEAGIQSMYQERWAQAIQHFEAVEAKSDLLDLVDRARQLLAVCRLRQAPGGGASTGDPFLIAVYHKNRGEYRDALKVCRKADGGGKDERFLYLAASLHCLSQELAEAASTLEEAIASNSENRVHAFHDPDFAELRKRQEYAYLFGLG